MVVPSLRNRLDRLERQAGIAANPGLFIVVTAATEDDVHEALLAKGIDPHDPCHMVVHLQRHIVDPDGTSTIYQCRPHVSINTGVDLGRVSRR
ncbi:MAG: hypothetical protein AB7P20_11425 [Rhizobiaceae bacterium]